VGLNVSDPYELGSDGSMILKLVVNTQGNQVVVISAMKLPTEMYRISLPEVQLAASQKGHCCL